MGRKDQFVEELLEVVDVDEPLDVFLRAFSEDLCPPASGLRLGAAAVEAIAAAIREGSQTDTSPLEDPTQ